MSLQDYLECKIDHPDVFFTIVYLLKRHGFTRLDQKMFCKNTKAYFDFEYLNQYQTVEEFLISWPIYKFCSK